MRTLTTPVELAPSLRHELNNPLALVAGNLSLAQKKCGQLAAELPENKRDSLLALSRILSQAQAGADRIAELVSQSLTPEQLRTPAAAHREVVGSEPRASVLVIDDEALMCELLCCLLEDDYRITGAPHAQAALNRLLDGESFDVVLCDLMMPELSGMDVYAQLLSHRPAQAARFIFMTGGTYTEQGTEFLKQQPDPPLVKPFSYDQVRRVIDARLQSLGPLRPEGAVNA